MRFLTAGESHGEALNAIISEFPSGVKIDTDFINSELAKRQTGFGRGKRMAIEKDEIKILAGLNRGKSTGSPISLIINNLDWKNSKERINSEENILNPRPGHADLPGFIKYRLKSIRDVIERSSARETAARVAVGAFAKLFLETFGVRITGYVEQIGDIKINKETHLFSSGGRPCSQALEGLSDMLDRISKSSLRCPDESAEAGMIKNIQNAISKGDTIGGSARVIVSGLIPGLGSFAQWDLRLDGKIAAAIMSIPSVKAIGFGAGFSSGSIGGLEFHDEIFYNGENGFYRTSNNAGGIEGGMTNGENIDVQAVIKPIPTTSTGLKTVDVKTKNTAMSLKERADVCAVPAISVIAEAVVAIEIMNAFQDKFGKDNIEEILENYNNYKKYLENI